MVTPYLYLKYFIKELTTPLNYLFSFLVGATINSILSGNPFDKITPFIVPIIVQSIARASVHFKNRNNILLLQLLEHSTEPSFIVDKEGHIIVSAGHSREIFTKFKIENIKEFLNIDNSFIEGNFKDVYSMITEKWYKIIIKTINSQYLIWLEDITESVNLDLRVGIQRQFSNDIMNSLSDLVYQNDIYERLAKLILKDDYEVVFLTRLNDENKLKGHAYHHLKGRYEKSESIEIENDSMAPVSLSRQNNKIISDSYVNYDNIEDFNKKYPFDSEIIKFMGSEIKNFVNYHKSDISIIAFNKNEGITSSDLRIMEAAVDNARIVSSLVDMAKENDARFLESMEGLCAAAEFSDEITGKHIYRVNQFSELIANEYGLEKKTCIWLGQVAAIHDIGKVAIPEIIKITRKYTPEERLKMQTHTVIGSEIITKMIGDGKKPDERFYLAKKIALHHHQEWCGEGYPAIIDLQDNIVKIYSNKDQSDLQLRPLKEEEIPIEALVVSLADRYDALRSPRHYKDGFTHEKTMEILKKDNRSGRTGEEVFGPRLFNVFLDINERLDTIYNQMAD